MAKKRLVVKIGTNLLTYQDGRLNIDLAQGFVAELAKLFKSGYEVLLVTSGAVGAGRSELKLKKESKTIPYRQVLAAVGQAILMNHYREFFNAHKITIAQVLLTNLDFCHRKNFLNTKNILELLLKNHVIPIINENDVTAYQEIKFGDNDMLSAKLAGLVAADLLIILTDVDGLYTKNPLLYKDAKLIRHVKSVDEELEKSATGTLSERSMGGMVSKIRAAKYATLAGVDTIIASGLKPNVLLQINLHQKSCGTFFASQGNAIETTKKWLQPQVISTAKITIDRGAERALSQKGSSLLASGIKTIIGNFKRGDVVNIQNEKNTLLAIGQVNYDAHDLNKIKGLHSDQIDKILGYSFEEEIIHRDNLILLKNKK